MANSLTVKVTQDGHRNAVIKLVGAVEDSNMSVPRAILLAAFTGNDPKHTLTGLGLLKATYTVTNGLIVVLSWNANSPEPMCSLSGSGELDTRRVGGLLPCKTASGYDGNINLATKGFGAGTPYAFTVVLRMVKKYAA